MSEEKKKVPLVLSSVRIEAQVNRYYEGQARRLRVSKAEVQRRVLEREAKGLRTLEREELVMQFGAWKDELSAWLSNVEAQVSELQTVVKKYLRRANHILKQLEARDAGDGDGE